MSGSVSPQVDVGALSIRGLSTFGPLLAALSADNVAPTAAIQLEQLGAMFLISGKHAAEIPDHLQRCSSIPIGRLALSVGWRKGDTASAMASSAGGQAVALLSLCLFNLYKDSHAGEILFGLSQRVLPAALSISSVAQLVDVGKLLRAKLDILGFGNELAWQVVRLHNAYEQQGLGVPDNLLDLMSVESMIDLLENMSIALRDDTKLVRITGTYGLGQVLGLTLTMFPQDTLVTVNGIVIFEGSGKAIVLEFGTGTKNAGTSQCVLESRSNGVTPLQSIQFGTGPELDFPAFTYTWINWVKDHLQLTFLKLGVTCSTSLLAACAEISIAIAASPELTDRSPVNRTILPTGPILDPIDYSKQE
ncbi:uncharacterized protein KY384_001682 [Bacidia gigantensis]|uniref:uncharacterized protein n=1 Tax=Bacidia gigantensis TaxID=2732470 RepID=UPI001D057288|nr:uncharacterized protein KY384_001682 [Bacidia gigantensis]KAG8533941.1 hypothetical protein KY384_001682 [Bacidia gigantensis]